MRSVFMVEKCLISRQENITLWTLVAECIWKMNRFNMIPQISQNVARKSKTNSATFWPLLISSNKLIKIFKLADSPLNINNKNSNNVQTFYSVGIEDLWYLLTWQASACFVLHVFSQRLQLYNTLEGKCFASMWCLIAEKSALFCQQILHE